LLLLTDNVYVANLLMRSKLPRVYNIKIDKPFNETMLKAMQEGLTLDDATAGAHEKSDIKSMHFEPFLGVKVRGESGKYTKLQVAIAEGKNRELRRFFAYFDAKVLDLKRVSYGPFELNNLPEGKTRFLSSKEYDLLHKFIKEEEKSAKYSVKNKI